MKILINGASDDLVRVEGCEGADEFTADTDDRWRGDLVAPGGTRQMRVTVWLDDGGCWQAGIGQTAEQAQLPPWPVTITQQVADDGGDGYAALLTVEAPEGTRLTNVRPEPTS